MLYFDHSASSPPYAQVARTVAELTTQHYANAAALHRAGAEAAKLVERAREAVAGWLGALPREVVFTSGGTESNNLAIKGVVGLALASRPSVHLITTEVEHASVYNSVRQLAGLPGVSATFLPVDRLGRVSPDDVRSAIRDDTALVSVMHVNNETGVIQPIERIGAVLADYPRIRYHVDGVQAIGQVPIRWKQWGVDLYTGSAHKFKGPKGAGFLLVRDGVPLSPLLAGGGQEDGRRGGTHNVPGIVGAAQALRLTMESADERTARLYALRSRLIRGIGEIGELVLNVTESEDGYAPHIVNASYPGMRPEVLVHMLEKHGILVSTQSACSSKSLRPSRVLTAMGLEEGRASGSIRISLGEEHTEADIDTLLARLRMTVRKLKPLERGSS